MLDSALNKARRAFTPLIPTTQLFDIPEPFNKTIRNDEFLIVDKMITRRQRILLFASPEQLKMLFNAETVLMDGTFSTCPTVFDQVYTIHSIKFEQCMCIISMLLTLMVSTFLFCSVPVCVWLVAQSNQEYLCIYGSRTEVFSWTNGISIHAKNNNDWFRI